MEVEPLEKALRGERGGRQMSKWLSNSLPGMPWVFGLILSIPLPRQDVYSTYSSKYEGISVCPELDETPYHSLLLNIDLIFSLSLGSLSLCHLQFLFSYMHFSVSFSTFCSGSSCIPIYIFSWTPFKQNKNSCLVSSTYHL